VDESGQHFVLLTEQEFEYLLAWAELNEPDPDAGLKLRQDLRAELENEMSEYAAGRLRGKALQDIEP
jgi:hypothetical protein